MTLFLVFDEFLFYLLFRDDAADALAGVAAEIDPTRPVDVDPECVYF